MAYFLARQNLAQKKVLNFRCNVRKCSHSVLAMFAYFNVNICTLTWLLDSQAVRQSAVTTAAISFYYLSLSLSLCKCKFAWHANQYEPSSSSTSVTFCTVAALLYIIWLCVHTHLQGTHTHICLSKKIAGCLVREPTRNLSSWLHS